VNKNDEKIKIISISCRVTRYVKQ